MYTIVAQEDCVVLRWRHDVMEGLMEKSTDMRAALTRAMTAAIVGKVINFTVSRSKANQTWTTWLGDWKYNAGAEVNIEDDTTNNTNAAIYQNEYCYGGRGSHGDQGKFTKLSHTIISMNMHLIVGNG